MTGGVPAPSRPPLLFHHLAGGGHIYPVLSFQPPQSQRHSPRSYCFIFSFVCHLPCCVHDVGFHLLVRSAGFLPVRPHTCSLHSVVFSFTDTHCFVASPLHFVHSSILTLRGCMASCSSSTTDGRFLPFRVYHRRRREPGDGLHSVRGPGRQAVLSLLGRACTQGRVSGKEVVIHCSGELVHLPCSRGVGCGVQRV